MPGTSDNRSSQSNKTARRARPGRHRAPLHTRRPNHRRRPDRPATRSARQRRARTPPKYGTMARLISRRAGIEVDREIHRAARRLHDLARAMRTRERRVPVSHVRRERRQPVTGALVDDAETEARLGDRLRFGPADHLARHRAGVIADDGLDAGGTQRIEILRRIAIGIDDLGHGCRCSTEQTMRRAEAVRSQRCAACSPASPIGGRRSWRLPKPMGSHQL